MVTGAKLKSRVSKVKGDLPFKPRSKKLGKGPKRSQSDKSYIAATTQVKRVKLTHQNAFSERNFCDESNTDGIRTKKGRSLKELCHMSEHHLPSKREVVVDCLVEIISKVLIDRDIAIRDEFEMLLTLSMKLLLDETAPVRNKVREEYLPLLLQLHTEGIVSLKPFSVKLGSIMKKLISSGPSNISTINLFMELCPSLFEPSDYSDVCLRIVSRSLHRMNEIPEEQTTESDDLTDLSCIWMSPSLCLALLGTEYKLGKSLIPGHVKDHVLKGWGSLRSILFCEIVDSMYPTFDRTPLSCMSWIELLVKLSCPDGFKELKGDSISLQDFYRQQKTSMVTNIDQYIHHNLSEGRLKNSLLLHHGYGSSTYIPRSKEHLPICRLSPQFWDGFGLRQEQQQTPSKTTYSTTFIKRGSIILLKCLHIGIVLFKHCTSKNNVNSHNEDLFEKAKLISINFLRIVISSIKLSNIILTKYNQEFDLYSKAVSVSISDEIINNCTEVMLFKDEDNKTDLKSLSSIKWNSSIKEFKKAPLNRFAGANLSSDSDSE